MTPETYLKIKAEKDAEILKINAEIQAAFCQAEFCPRPDNLRRALPSDIVVGAVIWYPDDGNEHRTWLVVEELRNTSDPFKAFIAELSRYGLYRAYVECQPDDPRRVSVPEADYPSVADWKVPKG